MRMPATVNSLTRSVNMGDDLAWFWSRVDLYLYTCNSPVGQSPWRVSSVSVRLSPYWFSIGAALVGVLVLYPMDSVRAPQEGSHLWILPARVEPRTGLGGGGRKGKPVDVPNTGLLPGCCRSDLAAAASERQARAACNRASARPGGGAPSRCSAILR